MNRTHYLMTSGFIISLTMMVWIFARLDWGNFFNTIKEIRLGGSGLIIVANIMVRAWRWNLIAGAPLSQYRHCWRSVNLGYLGNLIYPSRASEVFRMGIISRLAQIPAGKAVTGSVMDRVADCLTLGLFTLLVLITSGSHGPGSRVLLSVIGVFGAGALGLVILGLKGERWHTRVVG